VYSLFSGLIRRGLWEWHSEELLGKNPASESREETVHGYEGAAEESQMAGAAGIFVGGLLSAEYIEEYVEKSLKEFLGVEDDGFDSASYLGRPLAG